MDINSLPLPPTQTLTPNDQQIQSEEVSTPSPSPVQVAPTTPPREVTAILEEPDETTEPQETTEPRPSLQAASESSRPSSIRSFRSKSGFTTIRKPVPGSFLGRHSGITRSELHKSLSAQFPRTSTLGRQSVVEQIERIEENLFIGSSINGPQASQKVPVYIPLHIRRTREIIMSSDNITVVGSDTASMTASTLVPAARRGGTAPEPKPDKRAMVYEPSRGIGEQIREAGGHQDNFKSVKEAICCCFPK